MPSLFNRRSRSVSTSRPTAPASSSAHLAAASAFMANQKPDSKLSASAAAAALRTMSPTPTPIDQIQTKRMLNRQSSNASATNASRGRSMGSLQRRTSAGSMSERTFRSPSPGKSGNQTELAPGLGRGTAPPVPPVPQTYNNIPPIPAKAHRRSASVDVPPPRVMSPTFSRPTGRGQSTDRSAPVVSAATAAARRSVGTQQSLALQRSDSQDDRSSINFSYPRGSRPNSPPPTSPLAGKGESPTLPATNGMSAVEAAQIQNKLNQTAAKPVKKKKKRVDQSAAEGSHLSAGTMGAKPKITPLGPASATEQEQTDVQPVRRAKKKAVLTGQSTHFPDNEEGATGSELGSDSDTADLVEKRMKRASGVLMKQPSVVREDWEGEQEEQSSSPVGAAVDEQPAQDSINNTPTSAQPKRPTPEANMSRKIGEPTNPSKPLSTTYDAVTVPTTKSKETSKTLSPDTVGDPAGRGASISPSRSTRFSDRLASDLAAGRKHEPLGRSISPAKSALKYASPAASEASPTAAHGFSQRRGSSVTPSEASDVSADGLSRKQSLRVSFEAAPQVIDPVMEAQPSQESNKKGWFGLGKNKPLSQGMKSSADEVEEGMKPTPALPSFGSVRRSERSVSPAVQEIAPGDTPASARSASSSETSSIADPPTMDTSISSEHALGASLLKDSQRSGMPVPPQVTSVEGSGYASDTDSLSSYEEDRPFRAAQVASRQLGETIGAGGANQTTSLAIPVIAVQPATPGLDEDKSTEDWAADVPGGFPSVGISEASSKVGDIPASPLAEGAGLGLHTSSQADTSEPASTKDTASGSGAQQLMTIEEEASDDSSLYSDAAEDLSDLEGDGFGSINAIVGSPMVPSPQQRVVPAPDSPLAAGSKESPRDGERVASWDDTRAHWSGLAQRFRAGSQESEPPAQLPIEAVKAEPAPAPAPAPVVAKKIRKSKKQTAPAAAPSTPKPVRQPIAPAQPRPSEAARITDQSPSSPPAAKKRSATSKPQGHLRTSMRGEPDPVIAPPQKKPANASETSSVPRTTVQKRTGPAPAAPKPLPRKFSNDSDSDSSFKRVRRRDKAAEGKYTMKRSMRGGPAESQGPSAAAIRGGIRSMSPVDRRPLSPTGRQSMRMSMRGSADSGTLTLRGQPEGKRSSSLFSRNRKAKSPTRPSAAVSSASKLKSRFVDSDDEDGPRPTHYKSRFADSSDEDEPKTLRPVRGIPKRNDDGDSTDLDDSSDDQGRKAKPTAPKKLTIVPPPPAPAEEIASPPLSPTTAKKRGLWARFRGKKKDETEPNTPQTGASHEEVEDDVKASKSESKNAKQLGFDSAAERDALVERTRLKLEAAREGPTSPVGPSQRRIAPQRVLSDSWAPPKMPAAIDDRPNTAGDADGPSRPQMGDRQPTSETVRSNGGTAVYGKSGKKKKFPFLRKAFGLND